MVDVDAKPLEPLMVIVAVEATPPTVNVPALAVIDPVVEITDLLAVRSNAIDKVSAKATAAVEVIAAVEYNPTAVMMDDEARPPVIVIAADDIRPAVVMVDVDAKPLLPLMVIVPVEATPPTVNVPALAVIDRKGYDLKCQWCRLLQCFVMVAFSPKARQALKVKVK
jgi:hypothetical protein